MSLSRDRSSRRSDSLKDFDKFSNTRFLIDQVLFTVFLGPKVLVHLLFGRDCLPECCHRASPITPETIGTR
jgi:hypothetical protein